jgi:predicted component of type VI protein secretion system
VPAPATSFAQHAEAAPPAEASPSSESAQVSPLAAPRRYRAMDMDFPVEVSEEDKRFHNEARRFARLLVSEIKLYNEQKVREGRDAGDLYDRLREDIDRSRQMYDKRVRPEVSNRYDYFHHELVNMLAEGDAAKLGADYPGAAA